MNLKPETIEAINKIWRDIHKERNRVMSITEFFKYILLNHPEILSLEGYYSVEFLEWCGLNYIRLHGCWVHRFASQLENENWKSTEQLYQIYKQQLSPAPNTKP